MSDAGFRPKSPLDLLPGDLVFDADGGRILIVGQSGSEIMYVAFDPGRGVQFYRDEIRPNDPFPDGYTAFRPRP